MGVKYTIPFKALDDVSWRVDILLSTYTVEPITVRGVGEQAAILSWSASEQDNPYSPYITSVLTLNLYNQNQVDVREFQRATDRQYRVNIYRDEAIYWTGYLDAKETQRPLKGAPYNFTISAKDGLTFLDDIPYIHNNLFGTGNTTSRCPMNYIRQILFANLGLPLPIKWTNKLECTEYLGEDVFTGSVEWSARGEGFYNVSKGASVSCGYILENILRSMQCQIKQANGTWIIRRINDSVTGYMDFKQIGDGLGQLIIQSGTENIRRQIGRSGYRFINEDHIMINKPGLKTVKTTYEADVKENILPNGSFDISILGIYPLYWDRVHIDEVSRGNTLLIETVPSLDGRSGYAVQLTPYSESRIYPYSYFGLVEPLPIDAKVLVQKIDFNFLFSPVDWAVNSDGIVDFETSPFHIIVIYRLGNTTYYLNEFGYWTSVQTEINIVIDGIKLGEIAQVKFDKFQGIVLPEPESELLPGDICTLQVLFRADGNNIRPQQKYIIDNVTVAIEENNDVYETTFESSDNTMVEEVPLKISSSFGGYMVSNFMTAYSNSPKEFHFKDGNFYTGSLTGLNSNAIMRFRRLASEIFTGSISVRKKNWSPDEIYLIDSFLDTTFMPISATYNVEKCEVNVTAIECRNENAIFTEKFYGSNANILSN